MFFFVKKNYSNYIRLVLPAMHFWIDKRSQACGFGRARVAASLSTGSTGLGFGYPRRIRGKSMLTPIHRIQSADCSRPSHIFRQQQQQQLQQQRLQQQQLLQLQQQQLQQQSV